MWQGWGFVQRAEFLQNMGFTQADLQGCYAPGQATHVCKGCWKKSLGAKDLADCPYFQSV
jgi:hypothetical protein